MRKFSWYTIIHPDWHLGEPPLYLLVGPAILPDERTNDIYFKPNMKGGHRHNHIFNVCNRITFRGKKSRSVRPADKKYFVSIFWENIALMPDELNKILTNRRKRK